MTIEDFFDPYNEEHLKAYRHLQMKGTWPEGFIPEDISFSPSWLAKLTSKMTDCWIDAQL